MSLPRAWVPTPGSDWQSTCDELVARLRGRTLALLTGAGCSTESGIPDYRGEETARRARNPIQFREFLASEHGRRRYWARATLGWPRFKSSEPNRAHRAATTLEQSGVSVGVITQNVDRLHRRAGSERVVELHGALEDVVCLDCAHVEHRDALQERLLAKNPGWLDVTAEMAPDGDSELDAERVEGFTVVACELCGGVLKPHVVFFGEGVPRPTVDAAFELQARADALVVVGSSLTVFSGYRFVRRALATEQPVFVVNVGSTRADDVAALRVAGTAGDVLERLARELS